MYGSHPYHLSPLEPSEATNFTISLNASVLFVPHSLSYCTVVLVAKISRVYNFVLPIKRFSSFVTNYFSSVFDRVSKSQRNTRIRLIREIYNQQEFRLAMAMSLLLVELVGSKSRQSRLYSYIPDPGSKGLRAAHSEEEGRDGRKEEEEENEEVDGERKEKDGKGSRISGVRDAHAAACAARRCKPRAAVRATVQRRCLHWPSAEAFAA